MRDQGLREADDLAKIEGDYLKLQDLYDMRYPFPYLDIWEG